MKGYIYVIKKKKKKKKKKPLTHQLLSITEYPYFSSLRVKLDQLKQLKGYTMMFHYIYVTFGYVWTFSLPALATAYFPGAKCFSANARKSQACNNRPKIHSLFLII